MAVVEIVPPSPALGPAALVSADYSPRSDEPDLVAAMKLDLCLAEFEADLFPLSSDHTVQLDHGIILWRLPCDLTAAAAAALLDELKADAQAVLDGAEPVSPSPEQSAQTPYLLTADARAMLDRIGTKIAQRASELDHVRFVDYDMWLADLHPQHPANPSHWKISPDDNDFVLNRYAHDLARMSHPDIPLFVRGLRQALHRVRDEHRDKRRAYLEHLAKVKQTVDDAIRAELVHIHGWGDSDVDSYHALARRTGMSHTHVRRIILANPHPGGRHKTTAFNPASTESLADLLEVMVSDFKPIIVDAPPAKAPLVGFDVEQPRRSLPDLIISPANARGSDPSGDA